MKEKVIEILNGIKQDVDFAHVTALFDDGLIDSFDIINLISDLCDEFEVDIPEDDMKAENFNSVDAIVALISSLKK